ncbi:MAG: ABC transporter substrate-binding protein [Spirochaetaceae bacterium]|nr:ABC transporter substrate-binding protein [Spirochaetaceae bacterium]
MKKFTLVALALICAATLVFAGGAKESEAGKTLAKVRVGIHGNEGGAPLAAVAKEQGFFAKYGIDPVFTIVESGPAEMTAMRADNRTLDVGYIGAGVAWNPIDGGGADPLSFVFLDVLSNAEMLLAKKGIFTDANKNGKYDNSEIYTGLKGRTVYIEVGTTPGGWFKTLIELANEGKSDADKLWISCETSSYLAGYTAPNSNEANKVTVINTLNTNLPAGMATGQMDIIAAYSPATVTILNTNSNVEKVATTVGNFPPSMTFASTWVASDKWIAEDPAVAQNFINALYEAAIWRAENLDEAMRAGERLSQKPSGTFDPTNLVAPTKAEYQEWFGSPNGLGYQYMKVLYDSKVPNVPEGNPVKPFEQAFNDDLITTAIKTVK